MSRPMTRKRRAQEEQQQEAEHHQRVVQRSTDVLFLILERQRNAAQDARAAARAALDARLQSASSPPDNWEWQPDGSGDDDGAGGRISGGGWRRVPKQEEEEDTDAEDGDDKKGDDEKDEPEKGKTDDHTKEDEPMADAVADGDGEDDGAGTMSGERDGAGTTSGEGDGEAAAEAAAAATAGAGHADGAGTRLGHATPNAHTAERAFVKTCASAACVCRDWQATVLRAVDRATVTLERGTADLRPYGEGGALRALQIVPGKAMDEAALAKLLRAAGAADVWRWQDETRPLEAGLARLLGGLRVLRIARARRLARAFARLPFPVMAPFSSPFSSLVQMEICDWTCRHAPRPGDRHRCSRPFFFSRRNFPQLRVLSISVNVDSECPLELASGGAEGEIDLLPPQLTRLRVSNEMIPESRLPNGTYTMDDVPKHSPLWPRGEPLLVSLRSLQALAPTLQVAWVEQVPVGERLNSECAALPPYEAPLSRLHPGIGALTRVTALRFDPTYDCLRPFAEPYHHFGQPSSDSDEDDAVDGTSWLRTEEDPAADAALTERGQRKRALLLKWRAASRALFQPLASTLARLELVDGDPTFFGGHSRFYLPDGISVLTALTSLKVSRSDIDCVRPIRHLINLRRLDLNAYHCGGTSNHVSGGDFMPLSRLEYLFMTFYNPGVGVAIARALPSLATLVVRSESFALPPPIVLLAARARARQQGLTVAILSGLTAVPATDQALNQLIARAAQAWGEIDDDEDDEDEDDDEDDEDGEEDGEDGAGEGGDG